MAGRFVIAGPPCAGKSTYAHTHMEPVDLVYDYDTLHQALSGQASHQHDRRIRPYVLAARDTVLDLLAKSAEMGCWVITSSPKAAEIERLKALLGAEVVLLEVDKAEAHRRCDADQRPTEWHSYIDNWFEQSDMERPSKGWRKDRAMNRKTFKGTLQLKQEGEAGAFSAVFATLNAKDLDGDVTLPGAFTDGEAVRIAAWGHNWGNLPVGRGVIHEADAQAAVDGRFFLDTQAGKEHYLTVKELGDLQEWSYGFDIVDSEEGEFQGEKVRFLKKLKVHEVSPVMLGAGIGTHTTAIKRGARHTAKEMSDIQSIHDLAVALGAKCKAEESDEGEGEGDGQDEAPDQGKSRAGLPSAFNPLEAWLKIIEQESGETGERTV